MLPFDDRVFAKGVWIDAFLVYVMTETPAAPVRRLAEAANKLYSQYGDLDPVAIAEAAWDSLPLEDSRGTVASARP